MKIVSRVGSVVAVMLCVSLTPALAQVQSQMHRPKSQGNGPYTPPTCVPGVPFSDITCTTVFDPWIEQFGLDGISAGCGGGLYCPSTPVTRDQMAVFIEKAMRGTANWPTHTQLVWAVKNVDGTPNPTASGAALLAALGAIPTSGNDMPSATNPWLLKIGPGIYDLGTAQPTIPQYVNVEGSGINATIVEGTGSGGELIYCAGRNELRFLSVQNTGTGSQASGLWIVGHVDLTQVSVSVIGGSSINSAVVANTGNLSTFTDVQLSATGGANARALENQAGTVIIRGGNFSAFAGSGANVGIITFAGTVQAFHALISGTTTVDNIGGAVSVAGSQLGGGTVSGSVTCAGVYDGAFGFHASTCP